MYLELTKNHPSGLMKGDVIVIENPKHSSRLIDEGFAKESDKKSYDAAVKGSYERRTKWQEQHIAQLEKAIKDKQLPKTPEKAKEKAEENAKK